MRFGVSIPTCREGLNLPLPFASAREAVELAVHAEELGFDSVWGNDHVTAPAYVRADFEVPPRFHEPLIVLAAVAERTKAIRLGTGVLVLPIREPVVLTKQLTTLDQLSGGRLTLGVGTGAYREEFEAVRPGMRAARRAAIMDEAVDAIRLLLTERRASYAGTFVEFSEVELFPKAAQDPLPIYFGGNSPAVWKRVAERGQGWIAGSIPIDRVEAGHREIIRLAAAADRDPRDIDVAPQFVCCMGSTRKAAVDRFRASRFYQHLLTLGGSTLRGERLDALERVNLVGSPQELVERIADMERRGVTHLAATVFVSETPAEMREDMQRFADDVMAKLR